MLIEQESGRVQAVTQDKVIALQEVMRNMPQAAGMKTDHFFAGGMYCRRIEIPADTLIVSKVHKSEHLFIGCVGHMVVAGQGDTFIIKPGDIVPSPVGTKRVVHALTDVVVLTVHKTDLTEATEDLERELMEYDPLSMFDVNNQPKHGVLTVDTQSKELEG